MKLIRPSIADMMTPPSRFVGAVHRLPRANVPRSHNIVRNTLVGGQSRRERRRVAGSRRPRIWVRRTSYVRYIDALSRRTPSNGEGRAATLGSLRDLSVDRRNLHSVYHRRRPRLTWLVLVWDRVGARNSRRHRQTDGRAVAHPVGLHANLRFDWLDRA